MNSLEKDCNLADSLPTTIPSKGTAQGNSDGDETLMHAVVSCPPRRITSKLILQNMEEVLHTVKKKHKEKHRRKRELKKLAMISFAAGESSSTSNGAPASDVQETTTHNDKKDKHREKEKRHGRKRTLEEKSTVENGKVSQESPLKNGTILQHFQRTPKKEVQLANANREADVAVKLEDTNENNEKVGTPVRNPKVTNAFEVMMNARNKTIGSNTPGIDSPSPVVEKDAQQEQRERRKSKLQDWAEQKGRAKRNLEEEARSQYVEEQLEQRAKRFKQMLVNGASPKVADVQTHKKPAKLKESNRQTEETYMANDKGKDKVTKRRSKIRIRRLTSIDSIESIEKETSSIDKETEEFISKLNSPTKKRDSLLGYFPKKDSPKDMATKLSIEVAKIKNVSAVKPITPRRKGKKGIVAESAIHTTTNISSDQKQQNSMEFGTPSGRPRRSCVGKTRYDFDVDDSPAKESKNPRGTPARKVTTRSHDTPSAKPELDEDSDDLVIVLDDSTNKSTVSDNLTPQCTPKKLAPLFVRSLPKPSHDPEVLKARKAFLQSGVPEILRLEQEKQKQCEQIYEESTEIFPKISHVRQWSTEDFAFDIKTPLCSLKLKADETSLRTSSPTARRGKGRPTKRAAHIGGLSECNFNDFQFQNRSKSKLTLNEALLPSLANKRSIIKSWKAEFERFPTFKCYNQMREKYRFFNAIDSAQDTEQVTESFVVTRRTRRSMELQPKSKEQDNPDEEYKPPATAPNGELLFSEKYKPLLFEQVLVNLNPVTQLKEFLSSWSANGRVASGSKSSQDFDDSMDFNDSASQGAACNTVVLLGPVSSGKTNAVFALANEMNFNVLEINAGMKRTGKKLMQELQEATQSHQIRKDAAGSGSSQKNNLLKMSMSGLKSKVKKQNSNSSNFDPLGSDSSNGEPTQSDRKCLILIEDADIVFEQTDAGFTDAIYTLAASSKRPVIVVATNPNCAHLQRLMAQNTIHFPPQNVLNISKFLSVLSLMENCPILLDDIISLYLYNKRDLRKTLLELQFFIQSGGDREKQPIAAAKENNASYFASPRKRQYSTEQDQVENQDNMLPLERKHSIDNSNNSVYMHRGLFEFYTVCQNSKFRIPFPPHLQTFGANLDDILKVSRKLKQNVTSTQAERTSGGLKRKSKSPKKQWLTNAMKSETPLANLCAFYENVSVAALMDHREDIDSCQSSITNKISVVDRINTNVSECISHTLLEMSIAVNLDADVCPYNLFEKPKEIVSLCSELGTTQMRPKRSRCLDYEPNLRSICRSEKQRATLERRSTRFYHYLRTYTVNLCSFSSGHFDQACEVFVSFGEEKETTKTATEFLETTE